MSLKLALNPRLLNALPDIALFGTIVGAFFLDRFAPIAELVPPPFNYMGWLLVSGGVVLTARSINLLRKYASSDVVRTSQRLITHDLFTVSRNPLYAAELLLIIGLAVAFGSLGAFAAPVIYVVVVGGVVIPFEENELKNKFGARYDTYKRSVRRWL